MMGSNLRKIREELGMSRLQLARAIGYTGLDRNDADRVRKLENSELVPLYIARLVWLIRQVLMEKDIRVWQNDDGDVTGFPAWDGYDFEHVPDSEVRGK